MVKNRRRLLLLVLSSFFAGVSFFPAAGPPSPRTIEIVGSTSMEPLVKELAAAFMRTHPEVSISVFRGSSALGIKTVRAEKGAIGTCARRLKPGEQTPEMVATVIAWDGIAVVVNNTNPLSGLTMEELAGIFSGRIKNWKQVGGPALDIAVIGREAGGETASGTRVAFEEMVLQPRNLEVAGGLIIQGSSGMVKAIVAASPAAIGYLTMGEVDKSLKALKIDGVAPNKTTVQNRTYKLIRPFLFLTKGKPQGVSKDFIDFVLGPAGQAIVAGKFAPVGRAK